MPETMTRFSLGTSSSGRNAWKAARMASAPSAGPPRWLDIGDHFLDDAGQLGRAERQPANTVVGDHVDQEPAAQDERQLAEVDLGNQHLVVGAQYLAEVSGERGEMAQVRLGH